MLVDKFKRLTHLGRHAAFAIPSSVLVVGALSAYAVPSDNKRMVPIHAAPGGGRTAAASTKLKAPTATKKAASAAKPVAVAARSGEQIYRQMCSSCHGTNGQGGKAFRRPLTGDRSVGQLARFIRMEMPPDAPKRLPQADAQKVAEYIHDAFYSSLARERNKPARVELSRLTVRQYRNVITDLIGSFRSGEQPDARQGLAAKYFKAQPWSNVLTERVDPQIRFDYGTGSALPEQDDPYQFSMHWQGSVLAPETGEYEFILRTEQGATLWINDLKQPLIDAQVKSGDSSEHRASLFLLAGRRYPLRLEFFKGVHGVNDLKKLKEKPAQKASLALEWKLPKRAAEVIPQRALSPAVTAPVFVATTPFPPDDRSVGYERGTSISKEWAEATTEAALESTSYIIANLGELSGVKDDAKDRGAQLQEFCRKFVTRALRRPLTDEQVRFFVDQQFKSAPTSKPPSSEYSANAHFARFLYRERHVAGCHAPAATASSRTATAPHNAATYKRDCSADASVAQARLPAVRQRPMPYNVASPLIVCDVGFAAR
jgi:mono/diheme cytochrome c family protein